MVNTESATAEIRRDKKRRKKKETTAQKYNGLPYSIGRPYQPHNMFSNTGCMITGYYGRPLAVMDRPLFFFAVVSFFFLLFFLAYSQRSQFGRLPYAAHFRTAF